MTIFKKILVSALLLTTTYLAAQSITPQEFYDRCASLPDCETMSVPGLLLKCKDRNLHQLKIASADKVDSATIATLKQELSVIASSSNATAIKSSDGKEWSRVILLNDEKDVDILIADIELNEVSLVYIRCNEKVINKILNEYAKN